MVERKKDFVMVMVVLMMLSVMVPEGMGMSASGCADDCNGVSPSLICVSLLYMAFKTVA